jgi:hypothetical protein
MSAVKQEKQQASGALFSGLQVETKSPLLGHIRHRGEDPTSSLLTS